MVCKRTATFNLYAPVLLMGALFLSACAAKVNLVDRSNGSIHSGQTGSTSGSNGNISARIEDKEYRGTWIYVASGGSFSFGNLTGNTLVTSPSGSASVNSTAMASGANIPTHGNGLINMRSNEGEFIRCVFNFNSWTNTGTGQCVRNDGREFDLTIIK